MVENEAARLKNLRDYGYSYLSTYGNIQILSNPRYPESEYYAYLGGRAIFKGSLSEMKREINIYETELYQKEVRMPKSERETTQTTRDITVERYKEDHPVYMLPSMPSMPSMPSLKLPSIGMAGKGIIGLIGVIVVVLLFLIALGYSGLGGAAGSHLEK